MENAKQNIYIFSTDEHKPYRARVRYQTTNQIACIPSG